jgi:hypothetical protein
MTTAIMTRRIALGLVLALLAASVPALRTALLTQLGVDSPVSVLASASGHTG